MLPAAARRRACQAAAKRRLPSGYGDSAGDRRLRAALTDFLAVSRGLPAATIDVVVTGVAAEALGLLLRTVVRPGDRVAVEEPGYPAFNRMVRDRDATVVPIPVDNDGISVSALEAVNPRLVLVTAACQFPTTATLTPGRRQYLLSWARQPGRPGRRGRPRRRVHRSPSTCDTGRARSRRLREEPCPGCWPRRCVSGTSSLHARWPPRSLVCAARPTPT
ncbi:aminotransferase class I/II-fold pyridoxal phosphate-dependent enzyme [Kutzneria sp. NPDC051319]|uniref:aminotransferase class I/II-fold pyridoxal phosphate-dependent enzyme n=1 Tax=Kutzneria sp. NPDC051319 TaxID=3155047 RepID=UPI003416D933